MDESLGHMGLIMDLMCSSVKKQGQTTYCMPEFATWQSSTNTKDQVPCQNAKHYMNRCQNTIPILSCDNWMSWIRLVRAIQRRVNARV